MPQQQKHTDETVIDDLPTWDISKHLSPDAFIILIGDRNSGKTSYCEIILQSDPRIQEGIVVCMCGSAKVKAHWMQSIPRLQVIDPDIAYLKNMIKTQNHHIAKYAARGLPLPYYLHVDLILDDMGLYPQFHAIFLELAAISRHLGIRIFILCQYLMQVPKAARGGFDAVLLCGNQNEDDLKELHKKYANFMTRRLFIAAAITYTKNRGLFVIDRMEHQCFKMTMTWPIDHIPLGAPSQHRHSIQHYLDLEAQRAKERDRNLMMDEEEQCLRFQDDKGIVVFRPVREYEFEDPDLESSSGYDTNASLP